MFEFIFDYVEQETFVKYLRLTILVAAYVIFRNYYSEWAKMKQVKRQIAIDQQERAEKPEKDRKAKEEEIQKLSEEASSFGWGKKTRKTVKLSQTKLEETEAALRERNQTSYDAQQDNDIADLLED